MLISKKIWLLVGIAMATCAAVSTFGLYGVKRVNTNVVEIAENSVPALLLVSDMRSSYLVLMQQVYDRASAVDEAAGAAVEKTMNEGSQKLIKQIGDYTERTTDEQEKEILTV